MCNVHTWEDLYPDNTSYDYLYLDNFAVEMSFVFYRIAQTKCNAFKSMDAFLNCIVFKNITGETNFGYLCKDYNQMLECLSYNDGFDWEHTVPVTEDIDADEARWAGELLAYFHWAYTVDFSDWLKYFSSEDVVNMYYPGHEASFENMVEKLKYRYDRAKAEGDFRQNNNYNS